MLVVDASAVADLLLGTSRAAAVRREIGDHSLHAPHLMAVEVTSVLGSFVRQEAIDLAIALRALHELDDLGVSWYEHDAVLERTLGLRDRLTTYDATYVALAEGVGAPLLTCDVRLARASGHRAEVRLIDG